MDNVENQEVMDAPKVERVSLDEIRQEEQAQENEKTDELVDRIMQQILQIK